MEWVACAERLPEVETHGERGASEVVLTFGEYGIELRALTQTPYGDGHLSGWETEEGDWCEYARVTHWMPLPALPVPIPQEANAWTPPS